MVFPVVISGCESWTIIRLRAEELMSSNCGVGEDSFERPLDCKVEKGMATHSTILTWRIHGVAQSRTWPKWLSSSSSSFLYSPTLTSIHDYWKTIALTRWTFVGKAMSLLLNMLSRLVITFLPRSKCLLISWLQSPSALILEPPKIESITVSIVSPSICHEVMGLDAMS